MPSEFSRVVIADTTCFILLDKIGELAILEKTFGTVTTTDVIVKEFGKELPSWVRIQRVSNAHFLQILQTEVDEGEASAIAFSFEHEGSLLVLDDWKARKLAEKLGLEFTGTLGVLLWEKSAGVITEIKPIIQKIQQTNFRFSTKVVNEILNEAQEK